MQVVSYFKLHDEIENLWLLILMQFHNVFNFSKMI